MARLPQPGGDTGNWGSLLNDFLQQIHAPDGTLKHNTVTNAQLADNAVTSASIQDGAITEAQLDNSVQSKLNAVGSGSVADGTITAAKLTDSAVTTAKLADNSVTVAKLSAGGTASGTTFLRGDGSWAAPVGVTSVAGRTGAVTLAKADVGLGNVDNTSDAAKNAATATLTGKTLDLGSNTLTGTKAQFNSALNDDDFATQNGAETLANKRILPRVVSVASSATPGINTDACDLFVITALSVNITSMSSGLSGSPADGQTLIVRIKDNGTARTITWGTTWRAIGVTLPVSTVAGKTTYIAAKWNAADTKFDVLAVGFEA